MDELFWFNQKYVTCETAAMKWNTLEPIRWKNAQVWIEK